jgi:hypothetical protein
MIEILGPEIEIPTELEYALSKFDLHDFERRIQKYIEFWNIGGHNKIQKVKFEVASDEESSPKENSHRQIVDLTQAPTALAIEFNEEINLIPHIKELFKKVLDGDCEKQCLNDLESFISKKGYDFPKIEGMVAHINKN